MYSFVQCSLSRPKWIGLVFLQWLPWILRMDRPGKPLTKKSILLQTKVHKHFQIIFLYFVLSDRIFKQYLSVKNLN
jgi:hypothetical protein